MSLPNDDEDDRKPPGRSPYSNSSGIYPIKKLTVASEDDDDGTNDTDDTHDDENDELTETSFGSISMSFASDITSIGAAGGGGGSAVAASASAQHLNCSNNSSSSSNNNHDNNISTQYDEVAVRERRRRNLRQLQQLGVATGITFSLFLYLLIPTALLLSMILFGGVSAAFVTRLAVHLQWEFQRTVLEGYGIGEYLPAGTYQLLTSTSLHDILTDPDGLFGGSEHMPYILLYLIPGLTPEQRNAFVNRLSPIHQNLLRDDRGLLGYLQNRNRHRQSQSQSQPRDNGFLMRLLMGDERLRQQQQQSQLQIQIQNTRPRSNSSGSTSTNGNGNIRLELELPPTIPEGTSWGDTSALGPDDGNGNNNNNPSAAVAVGTTIVTATTTSAAVEIPATVVSPIVGRAVVLNNAPPIQIPESIPPPPSVVVDTVVSTAAAAATDRESSTSPTNNTARPRPATNISGGDGVLFDAIGTAVSNIIGGATQTVRTQARDSIRGALSGPIFRASVGATALGLGIGAIGLMSGAYDAESLITPVAQLVRGLFGRSSSGGGSSGSLPSSSALVGATLASGTTAAVVGAFGFYYRSGDNNGNDNGHTSNNNNDNIDSSKCDKNSNAAK